MSYKCYICDRTFRKPEHLGVHSVMHRASDLKKDEAPAPKESTKDDVLKLLAEKLLDLTKVEQPKLEKSLSDRQVALRRDSPPRAKFVRSFSTPIRIPPRPKQPPPLHLLKQVNR